MDQDEFWEMIAPLRQGLYGFAIRMLNNPTEAEDLLQDVLEKLWRKKKQLNRQGNLKSYAMTIMKNQCLDVIKKRGRYVGENEELPTMVVHQDYEQKDMVAQLKQRAMQLPTQQRMIVELKDFQGFDYEEISAMMGMTVNTLRVNLSRARKKLITPLKNEWR